MRLAACEARPGCGLSEREAVAALLDVLEYVAIEPEGAWMAGAVRGTAARRSPRSLGDASIAVLARRLAAAVVTRNDADFTANEVAFTEHGSAGPE